MINSGLGSITYLAREINNIPKNDTVTGVKTVNYDYGKIMDAIDNVKIEQPKKKEKVIDNVQLVQDIKSEIFR